MGAVIAFGLSYVIVRWRELTKRAARMAEYPEYLRVGRRNPAYRLDARGITRAADGALILPPSHAPGMLPKVDRPGAPITVAPAHDATARLAASVTPARLRPEVQASTDAMDIMTHAGQRESERDIARMMASQYAADARANRIPRWLSDARAAADARRRREP
jgi:hypothetical protein